MTVDLTDYTTFRTCAEADALITINDKSDLTKLPEQLNDCSFMIIGCGSNVLFAENYAGTVIVNRLLGHSIVKENSSSIIVNVAAGEIWHDLVCDMNACGFYGLENLALIPGTMGAAPVQNIGAYGVCVADFIESVEVFDLLNGSTKILNANECQFSYRDSIFKTTDYRKRYLITSVNLRLSKSFSPILTYQGLNIENDVTLTPQELLERVIAIRESKLPDPKKMPNAGSFFKNAIIERKELARLQNNHPDIPFFEIDNNYVKIPTAWLLENLGFKGEARENGAGVYEKHALILVNRGQAHGRDIYALACDMMDNVKCQFDIEISPEVLIIGG